MKSNIYSSNFQFDISQTIKTNIDYEEYYLIKENKIYKNFYWKRYKWNIY